MTVRFALKRKTGKTTAIRAVISHNGRRQVVPTGISIPPEWWDGRREQIRNSGSPDRDRELNARLAGIRAALLESHAVPTANRLSLYSLEKAIARHKDRMRAAGNSPHSIKSFTTLARNLALFRPGDIKIQEVNRHFIESFAAWLNNRNYTNAHVRKTVRLLQTVLSHENPDGNWRGVKLPADKYRDEIYLTSDEIEMIRKAPIKPALQRVRDLFLIGCYTGLRFSDLQQVNKNRVVVVGEIRLLKITTQKTKESVSIPIAPGLAEILDRYPKGVPTISNQKLNKYIKIIAEKAGLTQIVEITEYRAGQANNLKLRKCDLVYTHTARRSFATNGVLAGIPIPDMMKFTGHKSMVSFLRYVRTSNVEAALLYSSHAYFSG